MSGVGRQYAAKLASVMLKQEIFQMRFTSVYSMNDWRNDIRNIVQKATVENKPITLLLSDHQLKVRCFKQVRKT